ncbi:hypothetical protein BM221_008358 [Beauveria bassiana]|uniref:Uncharacterized protein n=1 Tax=Beauveria bassiana TaxID=176275 RepID=A0A2N6NG16_BEABA|nr:hypothetical protein BM221_008358 [Beauveria bassiana]
MDTKTDIKKDIKKDENTKRKCPWIQIKVHRSMLAQKYLDGDGIVTLNEKLCLFGNVVLREGTPIEKLDLAILRAYIHNQEHFDDSPSKGN